MHCLPDSEIHIGFMQTLDKMEKIKYCFSMIGLLFLFAACQEKVTSPARVDTLPSIFPDYVGVTIPSTIAPLNFRVTDDGVEAVDVVIAGTKGKPVRLNGRSVDIPGKQWHELLESLCPPREEVERVSSVSDICQSFPDRLRVGIPFARTRI